jgi:hypothetical protein
MDEGLDQVRVVLISNVETVVYVIQGIRSESRTLILSFLKIEISKNVSQPG